MKKYTRYSKGKDEGTRVITIDRCWDCPYAKNKSNSFSSSFYFTCELTDIDYWLDDNLIQFGIIEDCLLEKYTE
jgi:hypothetical protein